VTAALPTTAPPLVTLHDASVHFGPVAALREVNLTLHQGDRLILVGANGSGKTTLLRALHGLVPCSSGRRQVHPVQRPGPTVAIARAPVGAMLFQHPFLLNLSAQANVRLALWLRGAPATQRAARCAAALERMGLAPLARRPAHALSGGQQQRLALARAWAVRPDILFLDEPTANLDPSAKREVETLVDEIAREGVTVVMSTHNLGQAKRLATRVVYLEAGRLLVERPVDSFFTDQLPGAAGRFLRGELPFG
jgi:tungstate transport system ATP-binding protein